MFVMWLFHDIIPVLESLENQQSIDVFFTVLTAIYTYLILKIKLERSM